MKMPRAGSVAKACTDVKTPERTRKVPSRDSAKAMIAMSANVGKFEAMVRDRDAQIDVLKEQVKELSASLSASNALVNNLKMRVA